MRRRIVLMRHGEVDYFPRSQALPDHRGVDLTEEGRAQARAAGKQLADVPLDLVVTSGLARTRQTAECVLEGRHSPALREDSEFEEVRPNVASVVKPGSNIDETKRAFVEAFARGTDPEAAFLGGETFGSLWQRVLGAWQRLVADASWRTALVVAHEGVNRTILAHCLSALPSSFAAVEQDHACINIVDVEVQSDGSVRYLVRLLNHTPYEASKQSFRLTTMERMFAKFASHRAG